MNQELDIEVEVSEQAHRLVTSGAVNSKTTWADLDRILAQDNREQSAIGAVRDWLDTVDHNYTVEEAEATAQMFLGWYLLDPRGFRRELTA
jgi:hypothetical protein